MFITQRLMIRFCKCIESNYQSLYMAKCIHNQKIVAKNYFPILIARSHDLASKTSFALNQHTQPVNKFVSRTHTCGELTIHNLGCNVQLCGWLEFQRMNQFLILRDAYGTTQLIIPEKRKDLQDVVSNLTFDSVLNVRGTVIERPKGQKNKQMKTGDIEVEIDHLEVLNPARSNLPVTIRKYNKATENTQMKYRYLALRYPELQRNLRLRSNIIAKMREYLIKDANFVDIETPTLFKNTPGGAQEFIVPTRHPGQFYSLVQSPQQFKQLLMVGGFDRYFQVARCYRDESSRYDKQPEFTQLDIEMSFVDCEGIIEMVEGLLTYSWPEEAGELTAPFKRLKYDESMELYGTDKPDLRIPYQIHRLTKMLNSSTIEQSLKIKWNENYEVYALVFPNKHDFLTNSVKENFSKIHREYFATVKLLQQKVSNKLPKGNLNVLYMEIMKENVRQQLELKEGDVLFVTIGEKLPALSLLGKLRVEFTNIMESNGAKIRSPKNELLWITDFPLFSLDAKTKELEATHHPFTQPHSEDIQYLSTDPTKVRGLHYDLVMNGTEIAGGSIRIHNAKLQKQILQMLNIDDSQLLHLIEALEYGAPPHGGIALGMDRLICLLCNERSIKNVIAFPKTSEGRDLMSGAPSPISNVEKQLYHIEIAEK